MLTPSATRPSGAAAAADRSANESAAPSGEAARAVEPGDAALRIALVPAPARLAGTVRKRPRPGERRTQILEALGSLLEQPGSERVTTAALSARLGFSEAALYRHFTSKAQMFESLIELIDRSVFAAIDSAVDAGATGPARARATLAALLRYGEHKPGNARVLIGDALLHESGGLLERVDDCIGRIEARLHACLAEAPGGAVPDPELRASVLVAFALGRLQRFVRSSFTRRPTEALEPALRLLVP